jgi:hypothetical protein
LRLVLPPLPPMITPPRLIWFIIVCYYCVSITNSKVKNKKTKKTKIIKEKKINWFFSFIIIFYYMKRIRRRQERQERQRWCFEEYTLVQNIVSTCI